MCEWWRTHIPMLFSSIYLQQTNTADMLDLAIEYIKDLQKQVEVCYKPTSITPMSETKTEKTIYHFEKTPKLINKHYIQTFRYSFCIYVCVYLVRLFQKIAISVRVHTISSSSSNNGKRRRYPRHSVYIQLSNNLVWKPVQLSDNHM